MHDLTPLNCKLEQHEVLMRRRWPTTVDDKTEDPTQKRLDDALERGDVAKSQEVNTWFMIAGATLVLSSFSGSIGAESGRRCAI